MQNKIVNLLETALAALQKQGVLASDLVLPPIMVETTRDRKHGDFASNLALLLAKASGQKPRQLAELLLAQIERPNYISKIEIAGAGFINFHLSAQTLQNVVAEILTAQENFGKSQVGQGKSVILEFVSANPTGPLHVGHGRGAAFGATCANLLEAAGFRVHREYYVNDAGRQMHILALSSYLRYLELGGETLHFPTSAYQGDYIVEIARRLRVEFGEALRRPLTDLYEKLPTDKNDGGDGDFYIDALIARAKVALGNDNYETIFKRSLDPILADIREDLEEFGVTYDEWFSEAHLIKSGAAEQGMQQLKQVNATYEKEGAIWFKASLFGDEKDRVIIRENGQPTYFASDIAYHLNKYERGFDLLIDVLGADHHGYAPRIRAFLQALNLDADRLNVLLVQFAILYRGKTKVPMSTRSGTFVTLRELRKEVGNDAARFFYIMRKNDQHLDFDLDLAKSHSLENPVYYIQYAHARICSTFEQLSAQGLSFDAQLGLENLSLLTKPLEIELLTALSRYRKTVEKAALQHEPHTLAHYLQELAALFHSYYNAERFIVPENSLCQARFTLIKAIKQVIANGLTLLGVSQPERM